MTDRTGPTAKKSETERPPGLPVAANEDAPGSFTVADLLAHHEANPQPCKSFFTAHFLFFPLINNFLLFTVVPNDNTDPYGRPHVWLPYGRDEETGETVFYSRYCIPMDTDAYEIGFACVPLSMTTGTTTTTTPTTTSTSTPLPLTADQHSEHFKAGSVPPHLALYYAPKVVKVGTTLRICQLRYNRTTNNIEWMCLAHALSPNTSVDSFKPKLRVKCPSLEKKFTCEDILNFLRYYNVESDGTFYAASIDTSNDAAGFTRAVVNKDGTTRFVTTTFPDKDCKSLLFYCLINEFSIINNLVLKMVFKMGFRWRPVDFAVESTPLDTPPPCHFNPFRVKPMFDASPALNVIPTLLDRLPTPDATAPPLPWGTAPVPPLQPLPPRPIYSKKTTSRESIGGGSSNRTRSKTRTTTAVAVPTQAGPSTVAVPPVERSTPSKL